MPGPSRARTTPNISRPLGLRGNMNIFHDSVAVAVITTEVAANKAKEVMG